MNSGRDGVSIVRQISDGAAAEKRSPPAVPYEASRLRELSWELGARLPGAFATDTVILLPVKPKLVYVRWHIGDRAVREVANARGASFSGSQLAIRIYDITDVVFDGFNAHRYFDITAASMTGNAYWPVPQVDRLWLAEIGFRFANGTFDALSRSAPLSPDRDRPASHVSLAGLYVGRNFHPVARVENVLDAPAYEHLNAALPHVIRTYPLALAMVHSELQSTLRMRGRIRPLVDRLAEKCGEFPIRVERFGEPLVIADDDPAASERIVTHTGKLVAALTKRHRAKPFDLLHCHDWPAIPASIGAARTLDVPFVLSLHSTEFERGHGSEVRTIGAVAERCERDGIAAANLVIVSRSSIRQQIVASYGAIEDRILVIPDAFDDADTQLPDPGEIKQEWGFVPGRPLALFAGEISHAEGADRLVDALLVVSKTHREIQLIFAGAGPLKNELDMRVANAGLGDRCRFVGHVAPQAFDPLLTACDFVVIPARTWQDEGLAQRAIAFGKPVLVTRQAQIRSIDHGQNGLVVADTPGALVAGLQDMIANPMQGSILRWLAKQREHHTHTAESTAAEHYLAYETLLAASQGSSHA